jgi:hypothetical protein
MDRVEQYRVWIKQILTEHSRLKARKTQAILSCD